MFQRDRSKRYQMLLEYLPKVVLIIILLLVLGILAGVVCLAIFAAPVGDLKKTQTIAIDNHDYFNGTTMYFDHNITGVVYQNVEFTFSVTLIANENITGFSKDDVLLSALLYGRNSNNEEWKLLHKPSKPSVTPVLYKRSLTCSQTDVIDYIFNPDGYQNLVRGVFKCNPIVIFKERSLSHKQYRASVAFENLGPLYQNGLLIGMATTEFQMTHHGFSAFQLAFRYGYAAITFIFFLMFVGITFRCQQFFKWHTPQKWLAPLMLLSIWYHDPLYAATLYTATWIFPFVSTIFQLAFIYGFLLYLLIFFHSLLKAPKDRTFLSFYLYKIVLVGSTYVLSNILLLWARLYNSKDAARFSVVEVPGYRYLRAVLIALLVVYALDLLYYIFKALSMITRMKTKYSNRFWSVASFSCLVVLSFLGVTITNSGFKYSSESLAFLVSHTIIFLYFVILSILFLPGWTEDLPEAKASADIAVNVDDSVIERRETPDVETRQLSEQETKDVMDDQKREPKRDQNLNPDQIRVTFHNYSYEDDEHL